MLNGLRYLNQTRGTTADGNRSSRSAPSASSQHQRLIQREQNGTIGNDGADDPRTHQERMSWQTTNNRDQLLHKRNGRNL